MHPVCERKPDTWDIAGINKSVFIINVDESFHNARNIENPTTGVETCNVF
jgi:hypothetical protein